MFTFIAILFTFIILSFSKKNLSTNLTHIKKTFQPKTPNQKKFTDLLLNENMKVILGLGVAGTGKTFLCAHNAITQLKNNQIEKIVITRPLITVNENMGFLPGSMNEKMDPYIQPIFDVFSSSYTKDQIQSLIKKNIIEISPLGFMRGRTFTNSYIIADEMQNSSPEQMKMLLTRIGENTKLVITGDLNQTDYGTNNGLKDFFEKISNKKFKSIGWTVFNDKDIQRSEIVKTIVKIYGS